MSFGDSHPRPHQPEGAERFERFDVRAGDRPAGASFASRSAALGSSGAAGTAHPLATLTAIETLKRGGSAADAAIAAAACLGFLEPTGSGLGGDCYVLVWDPRRAKLEGLAGSGRSPHSLSLDTVRRALDRTAHPAVWRDLRVDARSAGCLVDAASRATARSNGAELFDAAIHFCEAACPCRRSSPTTASGTSRCFAIRALGRGGMRQRDAHLCAAAAVRRAKGDIFRNPDLARTYRAIAEGGRDVFYDGAIARTIERYFERIGGWLRREDLRAHACRMGRAAGHLVSRGRCLCHGRQYAGTRDAADAEHPREFRSARAWASSPPPSIHVQAEAKRLAYEDRARYYADPHFCEHSDRMAELQSLRRRARQAHPARPHPARACTRASRRAAAIPRTSPLPTRAA